MATSALLNLFVAQEGWLASRVRSGREGQAALRVDVDRRRAGARGRVCVGMLWRGFGLVRAQDIVGARGGREGLWAALEEAWRGWGGGRC